MRTMQRLLILLMFVSSPGLNGAANAQPHSNIDVVIYGATPAGIAAAIAAARDDCQVLLIEPTSRIGGLVTNGLSHTDYHSRESLSGAFLEFSRRVETWYLQKYGDDSPQVKASEKGVFAEPKVNLLIFQQLLAEQPQIKLLTQHSLESVTCNTESVGRRIASLTFRSSQTAQEIMVQPAMIIDASYEGDLMAKAGVPWRAGREGRSEFQESLAPEQPDSQLQAYNFRFIMTKDAANRVTPEAPIGYRREDFLAVSEVLKSGQIQSVFGYPRNCIFKAHLPVLPNEKYDINDVSTGLIRLSLPGQNLGWPDGSTEERRKIFVEHLRDQTGLLYFLQNDESVPMAFQEEAREWGWCRDEFTETGHLPEQLYVREARRMVGRRVFTQRDSEHAPGDARAVLHPDAIAMGDYGNNCHGTFHEGPRFGGRHTGEFYNPVPPYQIPYGTIVPNEIENLLVPVAVSATHVGFCAVRLEPIWMSLGQAAGHAAAQAHQRNVTVQDVAIAPLQKRLHDADSSTIYVSDVLPGHPDFAAVQWWGTCGGLHGLAPMPDKPGQRGKQMHGQYYEANPGHAADLTTALTANLHKRWSALAQLTGLLPEQVPKWQEAMNRGDFIRGVFTVVTRKPQSMTTERTFRLHPHAELHTHPPGEVDHEFLVRFVVADPASLPGIVVDDVDAVLEGTWQYSSHTPPYVGRGYLHDQSREKGRKSATFIPDLPAYGTYEVRMSHCHNVRRAVNATVIVTHANGESLQHINQQDEPAHLGLFRTLGTFRFLKGTAGNVRIETAGSEGKYVIADAVQFLLTSE
jgi:hypothetical protein